jgi:hypothetical protein
MSALTLLERINPRRADELRAEAASVLSIYPAKKLAYASGVSDRRARQMKVGEKTVAVSRFFVWMWSLVEAGLSPFPIAAKVQAVSIQSLVIGMTDEQLVKRFFDLLQKEAELEGEENRITAMFARDGDLEGLGSAAEKEAAVALELRAVTSELIKRGIDPRK